MPAFIKLLLELLPFLPTVVRTVESIHGGGSGSDKLQSAVKLLQVVVPAVTDHLASEPANTPKLESLISTVVTGLNAAGNWQNQQSSQSGA